MKEKTKNWLPYAKTPEEVGVSSVVMKEFIDKCIELNKEVHSFAIIRNNKIACEVYREPFNKEKAFV